MTPLMPEVTVNGETIPSAVIAAEAQNHNVAPGKPGLAWRAAARALTVRALLLQAARRAELDATPKMIEPGQQETVEDALIRVYLEETIDPAAITDRECRRLYQAHPARYRSPDLFMVSHILLAARPEDGDSRRRARSHASELIEKINANPKSFARHAKEVSDCPSGADGGQLGQIGVGDTVPEFEAALYRMAPGEISETPVETRYGIHIIRLDEAAKGRPLPYEAARENIRQALEKSAWANAARDLVARLSADAEISGIDMPEGLLTGS